MSDAPQPFEEERPRDEIAALKAELDALTEEARSLREKVSHNDKHRARIHNEIKRLEELFAASRDNIAVSDHAVVRYLERRYGFDFENVRDEILTPAVRSAVNAGAQGIKMDGGTFKIQGRTITTYLRNKKGSGS